MKFYTQSNSKKCIFVAGSPEKFNMLCSFMITDEKDFCDAVEREFPSMRQICSYDKDEMQCNVLFLNDTHTAADIMATIIRLFEENIQ